MNLKYYEQKVSLVWPSIMKHINGDLKGFFEDGGWKFLDQQGSDSEDDDDSDDSEEFNPGEKVRPHSASGTLNLNILTPNYREKGAFTGLQDVGRVICLFRSGDLTSRNA